MDYVVVKWLHVVSSTLLFGTGIGSAFYLLFATLARDVRAIAVVSALVVWADALFTATTVVLQPLTGIYLAQQAGYPLSSKWIVWSFILFGLACACWLPVVWLQIRMRDLARSAARDGTGLPPQFWRLFKIWFLLGIPAFLAFLAVFYLMVARPV